MILDSVLAALFAAAAPPAGPGAPPVQVVLDMNALAPGIQNSLQVPPCTALVADVAVFVIDPLGTRQVWSIGYLGGIDRGLAFGHMPSPHNQGSVTDIVPLADTPVNPGNTGWFMQSPAIDPAFAGPEVQYTEIGAAAPAVIPSSPAGPIFTVTILLEGAAAGDRYDFHLLDFVSVWSGGDGSNGAFCALAPFPSLDTGGDSVPDGTRTIHGIDPDVPVPAPPAGYLVDFIDGPAQGGPATIVVVAVAADVNEDGRVDVADLVEVVTSWGEVGGDADVDGNGTVAVGDLTAVILAWGTGGCG